MLPSTWEPTQSGLAQSELAQYQNVQRVRTGVQFKLFEIWISKDSKTFIGFGYAKPRKTWAQGGHEERGGCVVKEGKQNGEVEGGRSEGEVLVVL